MLGLADARRKALDLLRQLAESGGEPLPEPVLLSQLVEQYVELHLKPSVLTWKNVQSSLKQAAMQPLHGKPAEKVTTADVVAVLDAITAEGKPHGAVNLLKGLKAMYNWAMDRGAVAANPCHKIRPPVKTTQRERILRNDEIAAVLGACDKVRPPFGDMVRLLLYTGARRNEVSEMRWSELSGNVWTLSAERSKSSRVNVLPLSPAAMELLGKLPRHGDDAYVFSTTAGRRLTSGFSKLKSHLDDVSGTSGWTLHDLRRTVRSKLSELGVPWEVARGVVGHSVDQLDAVYDRFSYLEEKGRALEKLADHLASL